jgi:hypothetical protein
MGGVHAIRLNRPATAEARIQARRIKEGFETGKPVPEAMTNRSSHRSNLDMTGLLPYC